MGTEETLTAAEACDLMLAGDIFTDGEFYYYCHPTKRKDGTSITVVQTYESVIGNDDPIAFTTVDKWLDEMDKPLWRVYLTSEEAFQTMQNRQAVMDSNGIVYFMESVMNPCSGQTWDTVFYIDFDESLCIDSYEGNFVREHEEDDKFILYNIVTSDRSQNK